MGQSDQYYHRYSYDAENRITLAETSTDSIVWERDGRYDYYLHGPLARTTLGNQLVQGIDYAYTLQGWLKGANAINHLNGSNDIGKDGNAGSSNQFTARDAFGFNLNYFGADYKPINSSVNPFPAIKDVIPDSVNSYRPLFNGNISSMAVNIVYPNATAQQAPQLYNYKYDQLNRITRMDMYRTATLNSNSWAGMALINDYKERTSYDANGNILTYLRQGFGASTSAMDSLSYLYNYSGGKLTNNRLNYVRDRIGNATTHSSNYTDDIEDQSTGNYSYDAIGNLTSDAAESITSILWNVYGKISRITRTATANNNVTQIRYSYDPSGNRISKAVAKSATDSIEYTFYARDASGNVMATYYGKDAPNWTIDTVTTGGHVKPPLYLQEQHLYGSSRLGVLNRNISIGASTFVKPSILNFTRGNKLFELSNHLGNVLATISDKKIGVSSNSITIDYYNADVISAQDYYPGGMAMPGRKFTQANSNYRYGFNGQEKSDDVTVGNYTAEFWEYDSRTGRRWNIDPVKKYSLSPYMTFAGNPIIMIDPGGNDEYWAINKKTGAIKRTKSDWVGDNIWIMDKNGVYKKLHEIKIEFTEANKQFNIGVASVLTNYANTSFPQVSDNIGLVEDNISKAAALFNPDDNGIYVSVKDGYISDKLTNMFNLSSALKHEKNHKDDLANGIIPSFASHFKVYSNQISDLGFTLSDEKLVAGTIASALNYLFSGYENKSEEAETLTKLASDFKQDLAKIGYSYDTNYKKDKNGQYNDVESFTITRTQTINGVNTQSSATVPYENKSNPN